MIKISKLMMAGILFGAVTLSSAIPVAAEEKYAMTASSNGVTFVSKTINEFNGDCYLYGEAGCEDGGLLGNPCTWKAQLYGPYAGAAVRKYASFGKNGSEDDIMQKSALTQSGVPLTKTESAGFPHHYTKATTVLYY